MKYFTPLSPDPFLKDDPDMSIAKFGHINALVDQVNRFGDRLLFTTTDATTTVKKSIDLAEGDLMVIDFVILAGNTSHSSRAFVYVRKAFRRSTGGNVTEVSTDGSSTLTSIASASFIANTTDQTVDLSVGGFAATTIEWLAEYKYTIFNTK